MNEKEEKKAIREFAAGIIAQTVKDWKTLIEKKACAAKFNEIRRFFYSDWGYMLCDTIDMSPDVVLEKLEQKRRQKNANL